MNLDIEFITGRPSVCKVNIEYVDRFFFQIRCYSGWVDGIPKFKKLLTRSVFDALLYFRGEQKELIGKVVESLYGIQGVTRVVVDDFGINEKWWKMWMN